MKTPLLFDALGLMSRPTSRQVPADAAGQAEFALLAAVVEQALEDATERIGKVPSLAAHQALCWLFSPCYETFSFNWICERFLVQPKLAQDAVMRRIAAAVQCGDRLRRPAGEPTHAAGEAEE